MLKVAVASKNPVKIEAATMGFQRMFPEGSFVFEGVSVQSGVTDQPRSDAEAFTGAWNRALRALEAVPDSAYAVGIEGGVEDRGEEMLAFAWIVVFSRSKKTGKGRSASFFLPPAVAALVREGKELGEADDIVFGRTNSKQQNGAIGLLTGNVIERKDYYAEAVVAALVPFKNPSLYL